ncbi:MAG TPA: 23S rRNA (adenine(2503)-C(2))-methyltransferase RlmN [Pyrinomonadaceae bacterium]|jgi:23S rRNA (adenine2503-C2)-methyltransferase|nr:23S rRNA (adenine(2503)-C(2))-methyltransferase RlmN [Pyrinomonadaceae bacterium]
MQQIHLTGLSPADLSDFVVSLGEPAYRARQLFRAIHARRQTSFEEMTDLPKDFRARLNDEATISTLILESRYLSSDGTRRYLFKTRDNYPVETVFIPEEHRDTICFSSQSGCPLQCTFCLTAQLGLLRNLTAGEIVEQIIFALNDAYGAGVPTPRGTNLVGMGAGEPFLNFENLMNAIRIMNKPSGLHIVPNRITVSTAGIVPRIRELATIPNRPHLAVSLAAPNDELRDQLMPINKKWPIEELMAACKDFEKSLKRNERFTFEYVMLRGVNDSDGHARELAKLINQHQMHVKVNLIPHNPAEPLKYQPSTPDRVASFKLILESKGVHAFIRRPRGRDILAACGQLAARSAGASPISISRKSGIRRIA